MNGAVLNVRAVFMTTNRDGYLEVVVRDYLKLIKLRGNLLFYVKRMQVKCEFQ